MEQMTAGVSALARYARAQKSGEQLAAADLIHAGVAFDVARAAPERALAEARTAYDARHRSAHDTGWTTEELRTPFGCRPPAFDAVRPAAWLPRGRPGAGWCARGVGDLGNDGATPTTTSETATNILHVVRSLACAGSIFHHPITKAGEVFSLRLRSAGGDLFTDKIHWGSGDGGRTTPATDVRAGTGFTIDSRGSDGKISVGGTVNLP